MQRLFADGGVIGPNPSKLGGTYAWRLVDEQDNVLASGSGIVTATEMETAVTNNQTELLAILMALEAVPNDWTGTVLSDSQNALGRIFLSWKWTNIPAWMHEKYKRIRGRLFNWRKIERVLLQGHPTKKELAAGVGSRGYPVSIHNKECDAECTRQANEFINILAVMNEGNNGREVS